MEIAVISDLHLGVGDRSDRFGHDPGRFEHFLDFLEGNFEKIVLLGDIWDPLTTADRIAPRDGLRRCREHHHALSRRFERRPYAYVHGNHDLVAGAVEGAPDQVSLDADGVRVLFTHGHHHDILACRAPWLAGSLIWLGSWLLRMRLSPLFQMCDRFDNFRSGFSERADRCSFQRWAVGSARAQRADVVVTGHTHMPLEANHGDVLFLNSGTCAEGRFSHLSLDTKRGHYNVHTDWS